MDVYFNFKDKVLMMEPESAVEQSFLTDLISDSGKLLCEAYSAEHSTDISFLTIKPEKSIAHSEPVVTKDEIDEMYEEMVNEG